MGEKVDPTWLAFSFRRPLGPDELDAGVERLKAHYGPLVDYPLRAQTATRGAQGVVVLGDAEPRCRWPFFAEDDATAVATSSVPAGFGALTASETPSASSALELGARVARDASGTSELVPPFAIAVLDKRTDRLALVNDWLGAGRCFEASFPEGLIWTNRAAAAHLFAGHAAKADEAAWRVLAGAGWFLGSHTPIEGVKRVAPGTALAAEDGAAERSQLGILEDLVTPRGSYRELVPAALEQATSQVRLAASLWEAEAAIDLSGGRDSRVVAAAGVAAGIDARYLTSDRTPGEAAVAVELVRRAPRPMEHRVRKTSDAEAELDRPLLERALNVHLLHDGMRHPQKVRGNQDLPRSRPTGATLSGHGGEIAHGFFYKNRREVWRLRAGGEKARIDRVMRFFAKGGNVVRPEARAAARAEAEATLAEGETAGLGGPGLLEWFYLRDRFAHRSGLASHAERVSVFATPGFVRAAFAMSPRERLASRLHDEMVAGLVPEWTDAPFFDASASTAPPTRRRRLWESPEDAVAIEDLLASEGPWADLYEPAAMREAWAELRAGKGSPKREAAFEGAAFRQGFEAFLERVNTVATR